MSDTNLKPVFAGSSRFGGSVIALDGPSYSAGQTVTLLIMGAVANLKLVGSMFAFNSASQKTEIPLGVTSSGGNLVAKIAADQSGSIDGCYLGADYGNPLFNPPLTQFTADVPVVPVAIPGSLAKLAADVVDHRVSGSAGLVSISEFNSPPVEYIQKNISGIEQNLVNTYLNLSDKASALLASETGGKVVKGLPPWPDPKSGVFLVAPQVNWIQLPDGRVCNAGQLAQQILINYMDAPSLEAMLQTMFNQGAIPVA